MHYIFDIETAPLPPEEIRELEPEFTAPGNWKDSEKIEAEIYRKRMAWRQDAALSPLTGQVVALGLKRAGDMPLVLMANTCTEAQLLEQFWNWFNNCQVQDFSARFIGFYSNRFDVPFILRRSWRNRVAVPEFVVTGSYLNDRFFDLAKRWELGNREDRVSLDRLARFLRVGAKNGTGHDFAELLKTDPVKAEEYVRMDLELTEQCAKRMGLLPA